MRFVALFLRTIFLLSPVSFVAILKRSKPSKYTPIQCHTSMTSIINWFAMLMVIMIKVLKMVTILIMTVTFVIIVITPLQMLILQILSNDKDILMIMVLVVR